MEEGDVDPSQKDLDFQMSESLRQKAAEKAHRLGVSLEEFILSAIREKIAKSEAIHSPELPVSAAEV